MSKTLADAFASAKTGIANKRQNSPFARPKVAEANGDVLDPLAADPLGIQVEVAYTPMPTSDIIGLSFNGKDTFAPVNGSVFGKVAFSVTATDVAASVGKTAPITYAVIRPDGVSLSDVLNLDVLPIFQSDLPTPSINPANAGVLDLNTFEGPAKGFVGKWPLADWAASMVDGERAGRSADH